MSISDFDWGAELKRFRASRTLTQADLAELLDVDPTSVGRWERGRDRPSFVVQDRIRRLVMPCSDALVRSIRDIIDVTGDIAVLLDKEFRIVAASAAHRKLLRYDLPDVAGLAYPMWTDGMFEIMAPIGGPRGWWSNGVHRVDFTSIRRPNERAGNTEILHQRVSTITLRDSDGTPFRYAITKTIAPRQFVPMAPRFVTA
jgi:transcriptional regulator with XRE-family HTH domain